MKRWKIRLPFFLAAIGVAGWLGYRDESISRGAAGETRLPLQTKVRRIFAPKPDAFQSLDRLRSRAGHGDLSPEETAAGWRIVQGLSVEQIRTYLAEWQPADGRMSHSMTLVMMLYQRWTQLAPQEAIAEILKSPQYNWLLPAASDIWFHQDPEGALKMIKGLEDGTPAQRLLAQLTGNYLAEADPATAAQKAAEISPAAVTGVMAYLGSRSGGNGLPVAEKLAMVCEIDPQTGDWPEETRRMIANWSNTDPAGLLAEMEHLDVPADKAPYLQSMVINNISWTRPELALDWLAQHPSDPQLDNQKSYIYTNFATREPAAAAQWALRNEQPALLEENLNRLTIATLREGFFSGDGPSTASMRAQLRSWQQLQPEAADAWLNKLPSDFRKNLSPPADAAR